jgi:phosphoheptose isomerase
MKKRILFISDHASPLASLGGIDSGGQNVYVDKLTRELVKLGYEIDIATRWEDKNLPEYVDHNGIRVIHIKAGPISLIPKENLLQYMPEFKRNLVKYIKTNTPNYKLVHANFFMSGWVAMKLKKELNIPFVITFHALGKIRKLYQKDSDKFPPKRISIEEEIVARADKIIAECPQDLEDLVSYYNADKNKIVIVPCGFDPHEFFPMDKNFARSIVDWKPKRKIILQLGRLVPRKGIDNVIFALKLLHKQLSIKPHLYIVGGETEEIDLKKTPEIKRLRIIARSENISRYVHFIGKRGREQLKYYYSAADVFVSTPWYEPFGITPLEAMACGTPVIGSKVGGIKYSVIDKKTGYLIPPNKPIELAKRLNTILSDSQVYTKMREQSLKRVNTYFKWSKVAQEIANVYEEIFTLQHTKIEEIQNLSDIIDINFDKLISTAEIAKERLNFHIMNAAHLITHSIKNGGKILLCGNGGSAMDAQHFATEMIGHFLLPKRPALPLLSLTSDSAVLTAVANDYSYDEVFSRQVEALGQAGDILFTISTSGKSHNILKAIKKAQKLGLISISLLGKDGGKVKDLSDISIVVPSDNTQTIQELHTHIIHTICEIIEKNLFNKNSTRTSVNNGNKHKGDIQWNL